MKIKSGIGFVIILGLISLVSFGPQEARVLRFPTVSDDPIVFSFAGDLYTVPLAGGMARKLTSLRGLRGLRPLLARRRNRSPSPASTTATARSTSSRPRAACPSA